MGNGLRKCLGASVAGSLLMGGLAALAIGGGTPASATSVVATIDVGHQPWGVSADGTHVWVTNRADGTVTPIVAAGGVGGDLTVGGNPSGVSSDGTNAWVVNSNGSVTQISAATRLVVRTIPVNSDPMSSLGVSSDGTHVWVTGENYSDLLPGTVTELSASTGAVIRTIDVGNSPNNVSSDGTNVWVANLQDNTVTQIDASTGTVVRTIDVGNFPTDVSSDGTHVWVANAFGSVTELDASNGNIVRTIGVDDPMVDVRAVSSDGTHVWLLQLLHSGERVVTQIDASTGAVMRNVATDAISPQDVSSDGNHVWVTDTNSDSVIEIAVLDTSTPPTITNVPATNQYGGGFTATVLTTGDGTKSVTSSTPTVCTVAGFTVSYVGVGTCTLTAHVTATTGSTAADGSPQSFMVDKATPTTPSISNVPAGNYYGGGFTATVSTSSDGTKSVTSSTPSVCAVSGFTISYVGLGTCALTAHVAASAHFAAANGSAQSFTVSSFTITTSSVPDAARGVAYGPVTLHAAGQAASSSPYTTTVAWKKVYLPTGMTLSTAGVLAGTPKATLVAGKSAIIVQATATVTTVVGKKKTVTKTTIQTALYINVT